MSELRLTTEDIASIATLSVPPTEPVPRRSARMGAASACGASPPCCAGAPQAASRQTSVTDKRMERMRFMEKAPPFFKSEINGIIRLLLASM